MIKTLKVAGLDAKGVVLKPETHANENGCAVEADAPTPLRSLFATAPQTVDRSKNDLTDLKLTNFVLEDLATILCGGSNNFNSRLRNCSLLLRRIRSL